MELKFENRHGVKRPIGNPKTLDEAEKMIRDFCKEQKFKVCYIFGNKSGICENEVWFDVGSHSEFFWLSGIPEKEMNKMFKDGKKK